MPELDDDDLEAELDALGDEIGLDEDTSYLDDAVSTPSVPTSEPGGESVRVSNCQGEWENFLEQKILTLLLSEQGKLHRVLAVLSAIGLNIDLWPF